MGTYVNLKHIDVLNGSLRIGETLRTSIYSTRDVSGLRIDLKQGERSKYRPETGVSWDRGCNL